MDNRDNRDNTELEQKEAWWVDRVRTLCDDYNQLEPVTPHNTQLLWRQTAELAAEMCIEGGTDYKPILEASVFLGYITHDTQDMIISYRLFFCAALHLLQSTLPVNNLS